MATSGTRTNGTRYVIVTVSGERKTISLGKVSAKAAATFVGHVDALQQERELGIRMPAPTATWLRDLSLALRQRTRHGALRHSQRTQGVRCYVQHIAHARGAM